MSVNDAVRIHLASLDAGHASFKDSLALIEEHISGQIVLTSIVLAPERMSLLDWVYRNGDVVERTNNDDGSISLKLRMTESAKQELQEQLAGKKAARH